MLLKSFAMLSLWIWTVFPFLTQALPGSGAKSSPQLYHTVHQFPNPTWVESIAVRSNGNLLVTLVNEPELYLVDPFSSRPPTLLYRFPNATALLGIDEVAPDEFAIVVGNWSIPTFSTTPGSYSIWTATFPSQQSKKPKVRKVTSIPEGDFLNGLATLNAAAGTILVGDAGKGLVYRVSVRTGAYVKVLEDAASMGIDPTNPTHSGINGLKIHDGYVYYTNTVKLSFSRVRIDLFKGTATGPYEILAVPGAMDDFAFSPSSSKEKWVVFATGHPNNIMLKITPGGKFTTVLGSPNTTVVEGPTSCKFGRTKQDSDVLYVTTDGGLAHPLNGFIQGGEVIAVAADEL
jgi:hypothetical protein